MNSTPVNSLPREILQQTLERCPKKDLYSIRLVSKAWQTAISTSFDNMFARRLIKRRFSRLHKSSFYKGKKKNVALEMRLFFGLENQREPYFHQFFCLWNSTRAQKKGEALIIRLFMENSGDLTKFLEALTKEETIPWEIVKLIKYYVEGLQSERANADNYEFYRFVLENMNLFGRDFRIMQRIMEVFEKTKNIAELEIKFEELTFLLKKHRMQLFYKAKEIIGEYQDHVEWNLVRFLFKRIDWGSDEDNHPAMFAANRVSIIMKIYKSSAGDLEKFVELMTQQKLLVTYKLALVKGYLKCFKHKKEEKRNIDFFNFLNEKGLAFLSEDTKNFGINKIMGDYLKAELKEEFMVSFKENAAVKNFVSFDSDLKKYREQGS